MKKMVLIAETGFCGSDGEEYFLIPDEVYEGWFNGTNPEMDDYANEFAYNNAAMYGIYPRGEEEYDDEDSDDTVSDNISAYWREYDPEADPDEEFINWENWG